MATLKHIGFQPENSSLLMSYSLHVNYSAKKNIIKKKKKKEKRNKKWGEIKQNTLKKEKNRIAFSGTVVNKIHISTKSIRFHSM